MSYYQSNYQQPPPQRGWHDQDGNYHQPTPPPAPGQNGAYAAPQYAAASQYPGQTAYNDPYAAGGGPVQQPVAGGYHEGYNSPRTASFGGGYGAPLPPPPQQYSYDPGAYTQPQTPAPQTPHQQYNPAAYAPPQSPYPVQQQYGYTPPTTYAPAQYSPQPPYQPSPPATQSQFPQYSPQPPSRQFSHSQHYAPPQRQQSMSQYGYGQPVTTMPYPTEPARHHSHSIGSAMQVPPQPEQYQISPALPGLAEDTWRPSPPQYNLNSDTRQSPSPLYQSNSHEAFPSPPSTVTPGPTPPAHGGPVSRSSTLDRHPSRPLPAPPEHDYFGSRNGSSTQLSHEDAEAMSQEELFSQVENAVLHAGSNAGRGHSPSISVSRPPFSGADQPNPLFAPSSPRVHRNGSIVNGHLSPAPEQQQQYASDSDAEASQGLAMLQEAEQEDWRGSGRFSSYGGDSQQHSRAPSGQQPQQQAAGAASDSDDYAGYDMSSFGGPDVQMSYGGNDPSQLVTHTMSTRSTRSVRGDANGYGDYSQPVSQQSSMRRSHASQSSQLSRGEYDYSMDSIHPFPPFNPAARVDASGTGGLSEPTGHGRRQSYDEGDEYALMEGQLPERFPDEPPDIFFQQASTTYASSRPLPAVPGQDAPPPLQTDLKGGQYPHAPDAFGMNAQGQWVPRSTSLISHSATPQVVQPLRSKTDAEERRLRAQGIRSSVYTPSFESTPASSVVPDLPSLGAKRFVPSKLGAPDFKKCDEPWSLMGMLKWLLQVVNPEQYTELKEAEVKEALVALFTNKVPTMNIADAEGLSNHVVASMYTEGTLVTTEEWVKLVPGRMAGVIYQLTGHGCYSATVHDHVIPGRCYSHHCQRTLKKVNLASQPARLTEESWSDFYHLKKEDVEGRDKKELERQNNLHEVVTSEDKYMADLEVLRTLYREGLTTAEPSIITPKKRDKFVNDVFGRVDAVIKANEEHLLPQLKYRQQEQGPWIVGFSDIFRQWIRKAKGAYLEYAGGFPGANFLVRQELDRNLEFRSFVDRVSKDKRSRKLQWDSFLKVPITRLQRYSLLLQTIMKNTRGGNLDAERKNLQIALDEVKAVTLECDGRVAEMQRRVDLTDLQGKLVLRPGMQQSVELGLGQVGRQLIHRGDLQRMGGNSGNKFSFSWLDTHALLFDHYMVIAKTNARRSEQGGRIETYDVSRLPIPMDLLILESTNDPAVQKSSYVKGFTSVTTVTGRGATPDAAPIGRTPSDRGGGPPGLQHVNTGQSNTSLQPVTSLGEKDDRIMWPFKIKHLGRETYTLFAPTADARDAWCKAIREAKAKHAAALYAQHAEPFRLRVMADSAFVYDAFGLSGGQRADVVKGTPVDRAIKEVEHRFKDTGRPGPICRARVNCATSFVIAGPEGSVKQMVAVGTEFGVFVSDMDNPRGWAKSIPMVKVTQIAVLEDFNLFLLITDKSLVAYPLDVICPNERNGPSSNDSARKAPQKLSGSRDVGLFAVGRQKDRTLVFYKKRENLNSVFKVLEPIYQKSTERRRGAAALFRKGNYEFFREFDEFYIPAECTGMNLFHSSLAVSTARGFEVLTLDKKQPWSVPDLRAQEVQNIAAHIKDQRALGMLRLSDQEFLLCYSNCAVYINKHGEVSRSVIMDFVGTANFAALYGAYLVLFDSDFVEIRNAQNGRLKQIIAGREIKCLDDGGSMSASGAANGGAPPNGYVNGPTVPGSRTVKFVMQHPEAERTQIVVELLLNENMKE